MDAIVASDDPTVVQILATIDAVTHVWFGADTTVNGWRISWLRVSDAGAVGRDSDLLKCPTGCPTVAAHPCPFMPVCALKGRQNQLRSGLVWWTMGSRNLSGLGTGAAFEVMPPDVPQRAV